VSDPRVERLAAVLVDYSVAAKEGQQITVEAPSLAAPLVREVYRRILAVGAHPLPRIGIEGMLENLMLDGSDAQLDWVNPARRDDIEEVDGRVVIMAPNNTRSLTGVDAAKQARLHRALEPQRNRYLQRAAAGELRWVLTLFPTNAAAQDAGMSLTEFEDFVYSAGFVDRDDPVGEWERFGERLERVGTFLDGVSELRVVVEGTDLRVGVEGRRWMRSRGLENFPDGEIFTGPVETSVDGVIRFTYPAVFQGREVEDVRLRFEGGEVVEATASRGEDLLREMIAVDDGARRAGEFAFGLNDAVTAFTRETLFDEKIGGTVHLALGTAYPETGSSNRSALHWDLICDLRNGGEVYADGELVYRDGAFLDAVLSR
jgi:aminopeptidase